MILIMGNHNEFFGKNIVCPKVLISAGEPDLVKHRVWAWKSHPLAIAPKATILRTYANWRKIAIEIMTKIKILLTV